jgi:hypothetical protein
MEGGKKGSAYDGGWVLDGVASQGIAGDFDGGAHDDAGEVPGAVFDESQVGDGEKDEAVED